MKSFLVSSLAAMSVAHGGAFLSVWDLPYVEEHFTYQDLGRKLNKVFKIEETHNALREKRHEVKEENEAIFADDGREPIKLSKAYRGSSTRSSGTRRN